MTTGSFSMNKPLASRRKELCPERHAELVRETKGSVTFWLASTTFGVNATSNGSTLALFPCTSTMRQEKSRILSVEPSNVCWALKYWHSKKHYSAQKWLCHPRTNINPGARQVLLRSSSWFSDSWSCWIRFKYPPMRSACVSLWIFWASGDVEDTNK